MSTPGLLILVGLMMFTLHRTIGARNYSAVGYAFLNHALEVFKETNDAHEVEMLTDVAIPHVTELTVELAGRIGILAITNLILGGIVFAAVLGNGGATYMTVSVMIALYGGYALSKTNGAKEEIDEVCNACDQDLIDAGRPEEYQVMLNKYMDDPVD